MVWLLAVLLAILNAGWLFLTVIGLPGTWLIVATAVIVTLATRSAPDPGVTPMFSMATLVTVTALAALGELLEFLAGMVGSQRAGGTRRGALGAIGGAILGGIAGTILIPLPLLGSLLGACVGAAAGAIVLELRGGMRWRPALRTGVGAGIGRLGGTAAKLGVGVVIWIVVTVASFWP